MKRSFLGEVEGERFFCCEVGAESTARMERPFCRLRGGEVLF